ncbi:MAG: universal stress protein [Bacteroidetes bacterium]|nr:universal stress protein [Bacteroidota bacterium]MDA1120390.1 universal stress protein [Bacteroidota bacterium]
MFQLSKILVCLDLTKMDEFVLGYTKLVATTMNTSKVYFIHINSYFELPLSVREKYPELYGPIDQNLLQKMQKTVVQYFPDYKDHDPEFIVREGSTSEKILDWPGIGEVDLIILGKKSELKGKGVNPKKIANISHCSVLFVPEHTKMTLNKLFVPIDFTIRSTTAINQALAIRKNNHAAIILQHVFHVPHGYHYTGKTYEEFTIIMRENSEKNYEHFMSEHNYNIADFKEIYTFDDDDAPADKIYLDALNHDADIIILASRGRTKAASLLLGSVALELIKYDKEIPYMLIKDKRENMGFFAALMKV